MRDSSVITLKTLIECFKLLYLNDATIKLQRNYCNSTASKDKLMFLFKTMQKPSTNEANRTKTITSNKLLINIIILLIVAIVVIVFILILRSRHQCAQKLPRNMRRHNEINRLTKKLII